MIEDIIKPKKPVKDFMDYDVEVEEDDDYDIQIVKDDFDI